MANTSTNLIPHLTCRNASEAVEFYRKAFGAEPVCVYKFPDGKLMHAALRVNGSVFYLGEECVEYGNPSPLGLGGSGVTLHLQVPDCDAVFQRAADAGCEVRMPLQEMFWGDRYGVLSDPYGHRWSVATQVREVSPDELKQAVAAMAG